MNEFLKNKEYSKIIDGYINHSDVEKLGSIKHHNTTRLDHSLKVSYYSYKVCKKLGFNYESAAIGGLLHDLYFNLVKDEKKIRNKIKLFTYRHPFDALDNATKEFELNDLEKNIIVSHMWPLTYKIPKYKESFIVSFVDKGVSTMEFKNLWMNNAFQRLGVYFIFITNIFR